MDYNNLKMEEKPLNNNDFQRATSRRSRKDEEGRDFQCGCGKRYLSYPALYTHIKTKHDGRQPQGTQKTGTSMMAKRIKGKSEQDTLRTISSFLQRSDLKLLGELDQNHLGSVPVGSRLKKELVPKQLYQCYCNLMKQTDIHITKTSTLDAALVAYLFGVGDHVNDKLYDHYLLFARIVRNCYTEHAEEVYRACFSKKESVVFVQTFNSNQVQYFPIICDCLVRYYIPFSQTTKDSKDINLSLMELMLADFCDWLFKKKLTPVKVTLKKEYRLEVKPTPLQKHKLQAKGDSKEKDHKEEEESLSDSNKKEQDNFSDDISEEDQIQEANQEDSNVQDIIVQEQKKERVSPRKIKVNQQEKPNELPQKAQEQPQQIIGEAKQQIVEANLHQINQVNSQEMNQASPPKNQNIVQQPQATGLPHP